MGERISGHPVGCNWTAVHMVSSAVSVVVPMLLDCVDRHWPVLVLSVCLRLANTALMLLYFLVLLVWSTLIHIAINVLTPL